MNGSPDPMGSIRRAPSEGQVSWSGPYSVRHSGQTFTLAALKVWPGEGVSGEGQSEPYGSHGRARQPPRRRESCGDRDDAPPPTGVERSRRTLMHLLLFALSLQVRTVALALPPQPRPTADAVADSVRDARRARNEQASFERARRAYLPSGDGGGGRCDVHVGRFCWWADDTRPDLPPEAPAVVARRYL